MKLTDFGTNTPTITERLKWYVEEYGDVLAVGPKVMLGQYMGDGARLAAREMGWGRMWSDFKVREPQPGENWGFDNGAWVAARDEADFPKDRFIDRLDETFELDYPPPMVAVVPDIVGGGQDSFWFSWDWLDLLEEMGYREPWPWYLAVQAGMDIEEITEFGRIEEFDGIFLGGGDELKHGARRWVNVARRYDLPVHYAQVASSSNLDHAFSLGVDSVDTTGPIISIQAFEEWMTHYLNLCANRYEAN